MDKGTNSGVVWDEYMTTADTSNIKLPDDFEDILKEEDRERNKKEMKKFRDKEPKHKDKGRNKKLNKKKWIIPRKSNR